MGKFPSSPAHPERNCWGCDLFCPSQALACGNGAERTQHPVELLGEEWQKWMPAYPVARQDIAKG